MRAAHLLIVAAAPAACSSTSSPATAPPNVDVYVGRIDKSDIAVAVVRSGNDVLAYTCGGASTFATYTRWLTGGVASPAGNFDAKVERWIMTGLASGDAAHGTLVAPDGTPRTWTATRAAAGSAAGLYTTTDSGCRTGVIVWPAAGAADPDVQGTWCDANGNYVQVTPVRPLVEADRQIAVHVETPSGGRDLRVTAISSALAQ